MLEALVDDTQLLDDLKDLAIIYDRVRTNHNGETHDHGFESRNKRPFVKFQKFQKSSHPHHHKMTLNMLTGRKTPLFLTQKSAKKILNH